MRTYILIFKGVIVGSIDSERQPINRQQRSGLIVCEDTPENRQKYVKQVE